MRATEFLTEAAQGPNFYAVGDSVAYNLAMSGEPWKSLAQMGATSNSPGLTQAIDSIPKGSIVAISVGADEANSPNPNVSQIVQSINMLMFRASTKGLKPVFVLFPSNAIKDLKVSEELRQGILNTLGKTSLILDMQSGSGAVANYSTIAKQIVSKFSPTSIVSTSPNISVSNDVYEKLIPFTAPDKRGSGLHGLQPQFAQSLLNMFTSAPPEIGKQIQIFSGHRTEKRQKELWSGALRKYGSVAAARRWVAPPTGVAGSQGSRHNWGVAADLKFGSTAAQQWVHANCAKFGLTFRMGHEKWHIEPANQTIVASAKSQWLGKYA